jgi:hypothetical protein
LTPAFSSSSHHPQWGLQKGIVCPRCHLHGSDRGVVGACRIHESLHSTGGLPLWAPGVGMYPVQARKIVADTEGVHLCRCDEGLGVGTPPIRSNAIRLPFSIAFERPAPPAWLVLCCPPPRPHWRALHMHWRAPGYGQPNLRPIQPAARPIPVAAEACRPVQLRAGLQPPRPPNDPTRHCGVRRRGRLPPARS